MRVTNSTLLCCLVAVTSVNAAWFKSVPAYTPAVAIPVASPPPAEFHHGGSASPPASHDPSQPISTSLPTPTPFTGLEYSLGPFKRIRPVELQWEIFGLSSLFLYLVSSFLGRRHNTSLARSWYTSNYNAFVSEFAAFGMPGGENFKKDGGDEFIAYATGRRGVESGLVRVKTGAWHDLLVGVYNNLRPLLDVGWRAKVDLITIDLKLRPPVGTPNSKFVFAICTRQILREIRSERWDLKTFTQTTESSLLPTNELIAMTESGDLSNALLKSSESALVDALKADSESDGGGYFESLIISDMPRSEPDEYKPILPTEEYQLTLTLRLPPKHKGEETIKWIHTICNIADLLHSKQKLVPEIALIKRRSRRAEVLSSLNKASQAEARELEAEKKENALALKKKMEKDAMEAKLAKMSKEERIKFTAKEKERERKKLIKSMGKGAKK